jgi:hypothetical protein
VSKLLIAMFAVGCGPPPIAPPIANKPPPTVVPLAPTTTTKPPHVTVDEVLQSSPGTTGSIAGSLRDSRNEALAGVTIVASSPAVTGPQGTISNDDGAFTLTNLPPGPYEVTFYYLEITFPYNVRVTDQHLTRITVDDWRVDGS